LFAELHDKADDSVVRFRLKTPFATS